MLRGARRSLGLLAAGTILGAGGSAAAAAQARQNLPPGAVVQPLPAPDSGAELRRHLADLGANPRSLTSLIGAGRAAIAVGDGNAAIGFFGRAEEIAPRDARVKAGMASALVLLEQPQTALRYFSEASALGAPAHEIARDRGLAYDMSGDPRRAQQDYILVLQRGEDAETRRRLALSLAISGNRDAALRALAPLLSSNDRPAQRTRAFVLALTGDASGAAQAVDSAMPGQGQRMAPFLGRLASLNPAQKAMAVHFGQFPADGRPVQMAQAIDTSALPAAVAMVGGRPVPAPGTAPATSMANRSTAPAAGAVRRRAVPAPVNRQPAPTQQAAERRPVPAPSQQAARPSQAPPASARQPAVREARRVPINEVELDRFGRPVRGTRTAAAPQPPRPATAQPNRTAVATPQTRFAPPPAPAPAPQPPVIASNDVRVSDVLTTAPPPPPAAPIEPVRIAAAPQSDIPPAMRQDGPPPIPDRSEPPAQTQRAPAAAPAPAPAPRPAPAPAPAPASFSDVAALIESLPVEAPEVIAARPAPAPARPAPAPASRNAASPARTPTPGTPSTAARTPAAVRARTPAPPAHPARHWVQIANGAPGALAFELGRIRRAAPELMQGRTAWSAANGASGRLLIGPFASSAEARDFVNQLARKQVSSFAWQSDAGEEVARLPAR